MIRNFISSRGKYFLIFVIFCSICIFSIIGAVAYRQLYNQRLALASELNIRLSDQVSIAMTLWLEDEIQLAHTIAESPIIRNYCSNPADLSLRVKAEQFLRKNHTYDPEQFTLMTLMYFSPDPGQEFSFTDGLRNYSVDSGSSILDSIDGRSIGLGSMRLNYVKAIADGASSFISEARPSGVPGFPAMFMVVVPVYDNLGDLRGVFGFGVSLEYFSRNFITKFQKNSPGLIEIIDDRGLYLGHSVPGKVLTYSLAEETAPIIARLDALKPAAFHTRVDGHRQYYAATPVRPASATASQWWILSRWGTAELLTGLRGSLYALIALCLFGACSAIALASRARSAVKQEMNAQLAQAEAKRKTLYLDSAPYGVFCVQSKSLRILEANHSAQAIFGYPELVGMNLSSLLPQSFFGRVGWHADGQREEQARGKRSDGKELFVDITYRALNSSQFLLFIRDITELTQQQQRAAQLSLNLQQALDESEQLRHEAEKANRFKGEFLANMSHEIRTPMNAVLGMGQLLIKTDLTATQKNYAVKMHGAAKSLLGIINDILDFSKIEANKLAVESVRFQLATVLDNLHTLFAQTCQDKGIALSIEANPDVPPVLIGDPLRLGQVLINIVSNAVKFTKQGGVFVRCDLLERQAESVTLRFTVTDTGVGIDDDRREALFKPFSQADASITRQFGGTGLGLAISKRLLELMGGGIDLQSSPGAGTTVTMTCRAGFAIADAEALELTRNNEAAGADLRSLEGKRLLIAEDTPVNQEIACALLEGAGMAVEIANNGKEAVDMAKAALGDSRKPAYDLILMDLQMPIMDGYSATAAIRELGYTKPILAMTAHAMSDERDRCLTSGMDDHIAKPVDAGELYATLSRWLGGKGRAA